MRILFTGVTSFTGAWFVRALALAGHSVVAAVRGAQGDYSGLRADRLNLLQGLCEFRWQLDFGSEEFLAAVDHGGPFDVLCHHAADARNYKSDDFDTLGAVQANCRALPQLLSKLKQNGCRRILLTGSVFEADEGTGSFPLRAFSPYGLSKSLTASVFRYHADRERMALGKFVIANPFGPWEEPRFTNYLLHCWHQGKTALVNTPDYVRDNIPVSLLALGYADFVGQLPDSGFHRFNPSCYVETQGAFAARFAREIGSRLRLDAPLEFAEQRDFSEPMARINSDRIAVDTSRWREAKSWDEAADYYRAKFAVAHAG